MNPNVEKIASLKPTVVYSVTTLQDQFGKAFKQRHIEPHFLNLTSVATLKKTITTMGKQYDRTSEAKNAVDEINHSETQVKNVAHKHAQKPRVLILMGLPGASYMIATNQSYVGNLVQIAGGENVFSSKLRNSFHQMTKLLKSPTSSHFEIGSCASKHCHSTIQRCF